MFYFVSDCAHGTLQTKTARRRVGRPKKRREFANLSKGRFGPKQITSTNKPSHLSDSRKVLDKLPQFSPSIPCSTKKLCFAAQRSRGRKSGRCDLENHELFEHLKDCLEAVSKTSHEQFFRFKQALDSHRNRFNREVDEMHRMMVEQFKRQHSLFQQLLEKIEYHHSRNLSAQLQRTAGIAGEAHRKYQGTFKKPSPLPDYGMRKRPRPLTGKKQPPRSSRKPPRHSRRVSDGTPDQPTSTKTLTRPTSEKTPGRSTTAKTLTRPTSAKTPHRPASTKKPARSGGVSPIKKNHSLESALFKLEEILNQLSVEDSLTKSPARLRKIKERGCTKSEAEWVIKQVKMWSKPGTVQRTRIYEWIVDTLKNLKHNPVTRVSVNTLRKYFSASIKSNKSHKKKRTQDKPGKLPRFTSDTTCNMLKGVVKYPKKHKILATKMTTNKGLEQQSQKLAHDRGRTAPFLSKACKHQAGKALDMLTVTTTRPNDCNTESRRQVSMNITRPLIYHTLSYEHTHKHTHTDTHACTSRMSIPNIHDHSHPIDRHVQCTISSQVLLGEVLPRLGYERDVLMNKRRQTHSVAITLLI